MGPASGPTFAIRMHRRDGTWVLSLAGELDVITAGLFEGAAYALPREFCAELDVAHLRLCDASGLDAIVRFARSRSGRRVIVRHPTEELRELIDTQDVLGCLDVAERSEPVDRGRALEAYGATLRRDSERMRDESELLRERSKSLRRLSAECRRGRLGLST